MGVVATIVLFVNITAGVIVLAFWTHPERWQVDRRSIFLVSLHVLLASGATATWVMYIISRAAVLAWLGVAALAATVVMGVATFVSSSSGARSGRFAQVPDPVPVAVLVVHGAGAALAVVLGLVAATQR